MQKFILFFMLCSGTLLSQVNSTQALPLQCVIAKYDSKNLAITTAYSTAVYATAYRTLPVLAALFKVLLTPTEKDAVPGVFVSGLLAGLKTASEPPAGLITAVQTLSLVSFLIPPYWIRRSRHSQAECDYELALQASPNTTNPRSCYVADADNSIFKINMIYSIGLYVGVYLFLPIVASAIGGWAKGSSCSAPHAPDLESASTGPCSRLGDAFSEALGLAMIKPSTYALISAEQLTAIINFLIDMRTP
ncbi:MAG: hypothetical protein WCK42_04735 [Myxococcaceae bacterium]